MGLPVSLSGISIFDTDVECLGSKGGTPAPYQPENVEAVTSTTEKVTTPAAEPERIPEGGVKCGNISQLDTQVTPENGGP